MTGMFRLLSACLALAFATLGAAPGGSLVLALEHHRQIGVLLFHQVSDSPIESLAGVDHVQKPWTTPAAFDALLGDLAREGYHVIPLAEALAYLDGSRAADTLPTKPLLLTFDDGYRSALTVATPILRAHHDVATMFFEGHATDNPAMPGRLDRNDLLAMQRSRIWTLESHGWAGHSDLTIDARGTTSPYWYANLAWLPSESRLETPAEFETRVEGDLHRMRTTFEPLLRTTIDVFAYPSGEYGQNPPLPPGADPSTSIEAGHSNASGLTPLLQRALHDAGYVAAFAVSLPDEDHLASRGDSRWELPRIGVGAAFRESFLENLSAQHGVEYPEVADGRIADPGPICAADGTLYVAATNRPTIFRLDAHGSELGASTFGALASDRPSGSAAIAALDCDAHHLVAVQQAGFDPAPQPYLDRFRRAADGTLALVSHEPLTHAMNWLVGIAQLGPTLYGIDDSGTIFDVLTGRSLAVLDAAHQRSDRFAGLAAHDGLLYTLDRAEHRLIAFTPDGAIVARAAMDPDARDLAFDGSRLLVSSWTNNRRSLRIYTVVEAPHA